MRKSVLFIIMAAAMLAAASCGKKDEPEKLPEDKSIDLSENGTANCYLISKEGEYRFKLERGNGKALKGVFIEEAQPDTAVVLWQTQKGLITNVKMENGCVYFTAAKQAGNALICVKSGSKVIWSWHIWHPAEDVKALDTATGYELMNMNLGALSAKAGSVESYGFLYQWGRKDPFPGCPEVTGTTSTVPADLYDGNGSKVNILASKYTSTSDNTLAYAIANPTTVLSNYKQYATTRDWLTPAEANNELWGNANGGVKDANNNYTNKGYKTMFDPCPVGWRVPPVDVFRTVTSSGGYETDAKGFNVADIDGDGVISTSDFNYGWNVRILSDQTTFVPAAARYDGSYAMLYGSVAGLWGSYWSNAPYSGSDSADGLGFACLAFQTTASAVSMSPAAGGSKADAYSVRCIKE